VSEAAPSLVVIGNFDGVHRGHQLVLDTTVTAAAARGLAPVLMTFAPHPAVVLGREAPPLLTRPARKRELVARHAPSIRYAEVRFDQAYASQSPAEFVARIASELDARAILVGANFRFGKGRAGDVGTLQALGASSGIDVIPVALGSDAQAPFSSTRIRAAIRTGDLGDATHVLGRPHMISGTVVTGKKLGRTLGYPTCNLGGVLEVAPPFGIYAVLVDRVQDGKATAVARGVMSVGINPTTDASTDTKIEVHLFDVSLDLYGAELRVHLIERLRGEERFDSLEALVAQMDRDSHDARAALASRVPDATGAFG
jgi:riboflavin kinase / FMN adenylyltransferase